MYKALIKIGGYKIGEQVPAEKAEVWEKMYKVSPVEKIEKAKSKLVSKKTKEDSILNDYLDRNQNVVKKNISKDKLSKEQLKEMLEIELGDKNRKAVIKAINLRLNNKW